MKTMKDNYLQGNQSGNGLCSFQCFTGLERVNELVLDAFGVTAGISDLCVHLQKMITPIVFLGRKLLLPVEQFKHLK